MVYVLHAIVHEHRGERGLDQRAAAVLPVVVAVDRAPGNLAPHRVAACDVPVRVLHVEVADHGHELPAAVGTMTPLGEHLASQVLGVAHERVFASALPLQFQDEVLAGVPKLVS
eukprot:1724973-Rhodomonas_salina.1